MEEMISVMMMGVYVIVSVAILMAVGMFYFLYRMSVKENIKLFALLFGEDEEEEEPWN